MDKSEKDVQAPIEVTEALDASDQEPQAIENRSHANGVSNVAQPSGDDGEDSQENKKAQFTIRVKSRRILFGESKHDKDNDVVLGSDVSIETDEGQDTDDMPQELNVANQDHGASKYEAPLEADNLANGATNDASAKRSNQDRNKKKRKVKKTVAVVPPERPCLLLTLFGHLCSLFLAFSILIMLHSTVLWSHRVSRLNPDIVLYVDYVVTTLAGHPASEKRVYVEAFITFAVMVAITYYICIYIKTHFHRRQ